MDDVLKYCKFCFHTSTYIWICYIFTSLLKILHCVQITNHIRTGRGKKHTCINDWYPSMFAISFSGTRIEMCQYFHNTRRFHRWTCFLLRKKGIKFCHFHWNVSTSSARGFTVFLLNQYIFLPSKNRKYHDWVVATQISFIFPLFGEDSHFD